MAWMDIKGAVVADTVYCDGALCAKDVSFTLPGLSFLSADVQALGNMSVPLIGLLENMQASITKVGLDMGFSKMNRLVKHTIEFRWVQSVVKSDGSVSQEGCKAFIRTMPASTPDLGVEIGSASEMESMGALLPEPELFHSQDSVPEELVHPSSAGGCKPSRGVYS